MGSKNDTIKFRDEDEVQNRKDKKKDSKTKREEGRRNKEKERAFFVEEEA